MIKIVNDDNLEEVLATTLPVMIDCSAVWCGPCKALAPIVDEIANEYEGRAIVCNADVEEAPKLAAKYRIHAVPTVLFIKNGELRDKSVALVPKSELTSKLDALL